MSTLDHSAGLPCGWMGGTPRLQDSHLHVCGSAAVCVLQVMGVNGVSHQVVPDDLAGVAAILRWLSYVPPTTSGIAPLLPSRDPEARLIQYAPAAGESCSA